MDKDYRIDYRTDTEEWMLHEHDLDNPDKPPLTLGSYRSEKEARQRLVELQHEQNHHS